MAEGQPKFNPGDHLMQLRGKGGTSEYMPVKWRLVWLRSEHPNASTVIEHIEISPDIAIFRATVTIPDGGSATDYGSETPKDFGDFIEKAATKALGRALAQLGYGTQFVGEELDEGVRIVDSPVERPQTTRDQSRRSDPPTNLRPAAESKAAGTPYKSPYSSTVPPEDKFPDLRWEGFKHWAQPLGYDTRAKCETVIKQDTTAWLPGELRTAMEMKGVTAVEQQAG